VESGDQDSIFFFLQVLLKPPLTHGRRADPGDSHPITTDGEGHGQFPARYGGRGHPRATYMRPKLF
jgi:hypothetical protein